MDAASGKVLWKKAAPRDRKSTVDKRNSPASPSAAVDGQSIYVFFQDAGLVSFDYQGKLRVLLYELKL